MAQPFTTIIVAANGAPRNEAEGRYEGVCDNTRERLRVAQQYADDHLKHERWGFGFGAGAAEGFEGGPTLGALMKRECSNVPDESAVNTTHPEYYGTLEEFSFVADYLQRYGYKQWFSLRFVIINQPRCMLRSRLIWLLYHPVWYWRTTFIPVPQVANDVVPRRHEVKSVVKTLLCRTRLLSPRHKPATALERWWRVVPGLMSDVGAVKMREQGVDVDKYQ